MLKTCTLLSVAVAVYVIDVPYDVAAVVAVDADVVVAAVVAHACLSSPCGGSSSGGGSSLVWCTTRHRRQRGDYLVAAGTSFLKIAAEANFVVFRFA